VEPCEAGAAVGRPIRPSRAHYLLTRRAREVFDAVVASSEGSGVVKHENGGAGGEDKDVTKLTQLWALEALVLWLDAHSDIFTAGQGLGGLVSPACTVEPFVH